MAGFAQDIADSLPEIGKKGEEMSIANREKLLIVGGGYLGAMAALMASQMPRFEVTLLEKQNRLCGLYNNAWSHDGQHFDYGSRAILQTGIDALDDLLFSILPDEEYPKSTANLKEFSFQSGQYCGHSNCLDARTLPDPVLEQGLAEMLSLPDHGRPLESFKSLKSYCAATYGDRFSESLIRPAIEKLTGLTMEETDPAALAIHGLGRIIVADQEQSIRLKSENLFNENRIAYAKYDDNKSDMIKTYPKSAGLADYGQRIEDYLRASENVSVMLENSATLVNDRNGDIRSVELEDGRTIECDHVMWTIPSIFLARLTGMDVSELSPPTFRNTVLAHYLFAGELNTDAYFVYNYDQAFSTYRSTFYNNFSERDSDLRSLTVEVFHDPLDPDLELLESRIFEEQKEMGIVSPDSQIHHSTMQFQRGSWPNFANGFFETQRKANELIGGGFGNVHMSGKANGKHHSSALVHSAHEILTSIAA